MVDFLETDTHYATISFGAAARDAAYNIVLIPAADSVLLQRRLRPGAMGSLPHELPDVEHHYEVPGRLGAEYSCWTRGTDALGRADAVIGADGAGVAKWAVASFALVDWWMVLIRMKRRLKQPSINRFIYHSQFRFMDVLLWGRISTKVETTISYYLGRIVSSDKINVGIWVKAKKKKKLIIQLKLLIEIRFWSSITWLDLK